MELLPKYWLKPIKIEQAFQTEKAIIPNPIKVNQTNIIQNSICQVKFHQPTFYPENDMLKVKSIFC